MLQIGRNFEQSCLKLGKNIFTRNFFVGLTFDLYSWFQRPANSFTHELTWGEETGSVN